MMDFDWNDDQRLIRDTLTQFTADHYAPEQRRSWRAEAAGFSRDNWAKLAELGLLALPVPEAAGGLGGSLADQALVMEQMGRGLATEPLLAGYGAADLLTTAGSDADARLAAFASGAWLPVAAPLAAGDAALSLDGGRLSGHLPLVEAGMGADALLLPARAADGAHWLALLPADATGLQRRGYRIADGGVAAELQLVDARPDLLWRADPAALEAVLARAAVLASAELLGLMAFLFDDTLDYVKTRQQFGQPIGRFQTIQHRMARLYVMLEQARSLLFPRLLMPQTPADTFARAAAGGLGHLAEAATHVAQEAIQFHGGMGITDELAIGHAHQRIIVLVRLFGGAVRQLERYCA